MMICRLLAVGALLAWLVLPELGLSQTANARTTQGTIEMIGTTTITGRDSSPSTWAPQAPSPSNPLSDGNVAARMEIPCGFRTRRHRRRPWRGKERPLKLRESS
jgi:hypothetical protein